MKKNLGYILLIATAGITMYAHAQPKLNKNNVREVVAAMMPEEKAHVVVGVGMNFGASAPKKDSSKATAPQQGPVVGTTQDKVPGAAGTTYAIPRLGIPFIVVGNSREGIIINPVRNGDSSEIYCVTAWPIGTLLASSWDTAVYAEYGCCNTSNIKPAYPFGYGLSCSGFTYDNLKLSSSSFKNSITATLTITNQGRIPGKEVAEIYISAPLASMGQPVEEVKACAETKLLQPGETATLQFTIKAADLASFYTDKSAWIAGAGKCTLKAGASSADLRLSANFDLPNDIIIEQVNKVLTPQQQINVIKPAANTTNFIYDLNGFGGTAGM